MIRKFTMATAVLMAGTASAFAADLPSRRPPPVFGPRPLFTWTGLYVGGDIGYTWGNDSHTEYLANFGGGGLASFNTPNGESGGAHIGYNYQVSQFVFGVEGDVRGTNFQNWDNAPTGFGASAFYTKTSIPIEGSARARLGFAWDHWLFFATGGAAFAEIRHSYGLVGGGGGIIYDPGNSHSSSRVGWTVGGGVEYALSNNWSVRGEYRYADFGSSTDYRFANLFGNRSPAINHVKENTVTVGFSYKFDWYTPPVPVVAKY